MQRIFRYSLYMSAFSLLVLCAWAGAAQAQSVYVSGRDKATTSLKDKALELFDDFDPEMLKANGPEPKTQDDLRKRSIISNVDQSQAVRKKRASRKKEAQKYHEELMRQRMIEGRTAQAEKAQRDAASSNERGRTSSAQTQNAGASKSQSRTRLYRRDDRPRKPTKVFKNY